MSAITSVVHHNTPYHINTDVWIQLHEGEPERAMRILSFHQSPYGNDINVIGREWEPSAARPRHNHGPNYHQYQWNSVALRAELSGFALTCVLRPVEVLHYLAYRRIHPWWHEDTLFYAYLYVDDDKVHRASKTALPAPPSRATNVRVLGLMLRDAVKIPMRLRGANRGRDTLVFPLPRDEILSIFRSMVGPPTTTSPAGVVYHINNPQQLEELCKPFWDIKVFMNTDRWFNSLTTLTIKIPAGGNKMTIQFRFALMRRVFSLDYRAHTLQYWH